MGTRGDALGFFYQSAIARLRGAFNLYLRTCFLLSFHMLAVLSVSLSLRAGSFSPRIAQIDFFPSQAACIFPLLISVVFVLSSPSLFTFPFGPPLSW